MPRGLPFCPPCRGGIVCPWDAVPDALRDGAPHGMREGGGPFHAYNARATLARLAAAAYERLLVGGPSKGVAMALGPRPLDRTTRTGRCARLARVPQ